MSEAFDDLAASLFPTAEYPSSINIFRAISWLSDTFNYKDRARFDESTKSVEKRGMDAKHENVDKVSEE